MIWTHGTAYSFVVDNWPASPSLSPGTTVTPGASSAEGAWTQVLGALAQDVYGLWLKVSNISVTGVSKTALLDLGVDPAGGTAYSVVFSNIVCGGAPVLTVTDASQQFYFPFFIPAGATVAVRLQTAHSAAGTSVISVRAYGQPNNQRQTPVGQYAETLGTITGSNGVDFTPGNLVDGAWVSLGTTARALWWWQLAYQLDNINTTQEVTYIDLGFGASGGQQRIQRLMHFGNTAEAHSVALNPRHLWAECYWPLPAGTELWIRGRSNGTPDTGYNGVAIGIGG